MITELYNRGSKIYCMYIRCEVIMYSSLEAQTHLTCRSTLSLSLSLSRGFIILLGNKEKIDRDYIPNLTFRNIFLMSFLSKDQIKVQNKSDLSDKVGCGYRGVQLGRFLTCFCRFSWDYNFRTIFKFILMI